MIALLAALACAPPALAGWQTRMEAQSSTLDEDIPTDLPVLYFGETENKAGGRAIGYQSLPKRGRDAGIQATWVIHVFVKPLVFKGGSARYAGGLYLVDCATRRFSLQRGALHAADGARLDYFDVAQPWKEAAEDRDMPQVINNLCVDTRYPVAASALGIPAMLADAARRASASE